MFEDLDDSRPFTPSEQFRRAVLRRSRSVRRRRAAVRIGGATCAAIIVVPAAFAYYEYHRLDDVHRIAIPGVGDGLAGSATTAPAPSDPAPTAGATDVETTESPSTPTMSSIDSTVSPSTPTTATASTEAPPPPLSGATTFLVVGVDTNESAGVTGGRTDTLMLLRIDPHDKHINLLSIPRDLWVHQPGSTKGQRINSLIRPNEPSKLVAVVESLFNVSVDHYVQVDFEGFKDLTNVAGGVGVRSNVALRDRHTGLALPADECVELDGEQALALVRSRHTQYFDGAKWKEDPRSDFGRIERQQVFLRSLTAGLFDELDDPGSIDEFIDVATQSLVVDAGLTSRAMLSTAWTVRGIGVDHVNTATVQASNAVIDQSAVLTASESQIASAAAFLNDGPPDTPSADSGDTAATSSAATAPTALTPVLEGCNP
jgi:LCP family protein required for cell wall assembly